MTNMTEKTKVIGYVRVSTDAQERDGHSIPEQRARLAAYAMAMDLELVDILAEDASGRSLERPKLQQALATLRTHKASGLLIYKLDRLTRNVADMGKLLEEYFGERCEFSLISLSETIDTRTATGRLILNVLASVAQWQREQTGERTSSVMGYMKQQGRYTGGPIPFGWEVSDGFLVPVAKEQEAIALAREIYAAGEASLRHVADELAAKGFLSRAGKVFDAQQVSRMVDEKKESGKYRRFGSGAPPTNHVDLPKKAKVF